jgi:hypothetical protein
MEDGIILTNDRIKKISQIEITFDGILKGNIFNAVLSDLKSGYTIIDEGENYLSFVYSNSCKEI